MAAEAGATRVYAVETNLDAASRAREEVAARGFENVIIIIEGGTRRCRHWLGTVLGQSIAV
jgi:predicted O-methyltransferase YrrM